VFFGVREACSIKEDLERLGLTTGLEGKTMVVQGLGNVGYHAAKFFHEAGVKIIGIAEYEGSIHDPKGIDIDRLMAHRRETESIKDFKGATNLSSRDDALYLECDILIPAALENQITDENVDRIRAKIVGEAANGPIASGASERLFERGVMVIPDAYLNAGGVTVSYFEWLKNLSHVRFGRMEKRHEQHIHDQMGRIIEHMTGKEVPAEMATELLHGPSEEDLVNSGLEDTMIDAFHQVREIKVRHGAKMDLRTASFISAIDKIARSYNDLGVWP
jgi:glutamate dehydrogenase (NAD(P)+)